MSGGDTWKAVQRLGAALAALCLLPIQSQAAETARPIVRPFEISAGHIVTPITVRGRPQQAMLDTGAPRTLIDQTYAASLGMGPGWLTRALGQGRGTANGLEVQSVRTNDIAVGGWSRPLSVGMTDLGLLTDRNLPPVILGADLFERWVVELDFDAQLMTLHPRPGFVAPSRAVELPVSGKDHHYTVPVSIEGAPPQAAHIDLGAESPLMLGRAFAASVGVLDGRRISSAAYSALGIKGVAGVTAVREVQLAAFSVRDVPAALSPEHDPVFGALPINLGLPLLSRFHVWLDLSGGRMWLSPRPGQDRVASIGAAGSNRMAASSADASTLGYFD